MWGTDQKSSIEPLGFARLIRDLNVVDQSLGDGIKKIYKSEIPIMNKLRKYK